MRVTDVSPMGFESFSTTTLMEKNDFLTYVGLCDGTCLPPCRDDLEHNQLYHQFKEQYHISLNKQQERALQAVEGSNLYWRYQVPENHCPRCAIGLYGS